jgi:7-keto-8-aminopelargonate synthetase-like enzyme
VQGGLFANQVAIPALIGREDLVFSDRLNHASIIDGCRLSRATIVVYFPEKRRRFRTPDRRLFAIPA